MADSKPNMGSSIQFSDEDHHNHFHSHLQNLLDEDILTDFTLIANGTNIRCHKVVLAASSPYFKAMLTSALKESTLNTMEVNDTDPAALRVLVQYMYTGDIVINTEIAEAILKMSHQYQLETLQKAGENFMVTQVEPFNCISFYKFAKMYNLEVLQFVAHQCMLQRFKEVVSASCTTGESEFLHMSCEDLEEYIKDDDLDVKTEDLVFHAVVTWVNHDLPSRRDLFQKLLDHVRLPFCTSAYLHHVVHLDTLMSSPECQEIFNKAKSYQCVPEERQGMNIIPRKSFNVQEKIYVMGGYNNAGDCQDIWSLDEKGKWKGVEKIPGASLAYFHICTTQNTLILSGGEKDLITQKRCWLFDISENRWRRFPSLQLARCRHGSVAQGDNVYAVGGENQPEIALSSVEKYTKNTNKWLPCPELIHAVANPGIVSHKCHVYVFGGYVVGEGDLKHTQVLDTVLDEWSLKAEMPHICSFGGATSLGDKIYLVGGISRSCISYSPALDTWTVLSQPLVEHLDAPAVVWKGKILVGGGRTGDNIFAEIEEYDPQYDRWTKWKKAHLPVPLCDHFMFNVLVSDSKSGKT